MRKRFAVSLKIGTFAAEKEKVSIKHYSYMAE